MAKKKENDENLEVVKSKATGDANVGTKTDAKSPEKTAGPSPEKFQERLKGILYIAKRKKNMLEYQEINDYFADMHLSAEQFERILEFLEANNIDVLRITEDDLDDDILLEVE